MRAYMHLICRFRLHYVRSHAAVPQLTWETHKLSIFSHPPNLIAKPKEWSMDDLASGRFRIIELPVTFGCDGSKVTSLSAKCAIFMTVV